MLFRSRRPDVVTVLRKPNGGQASARNLGIEHARGEWITFTDPDDILQRDVLRDVAAFIDANPETELVAISRLLYHDDTEKFSRHPLHGHFAAKNVLRNLEGNPEHFFGSAPAGFFRRAVLEAEQLRFSELIKPNFEDGYFCNVYLLRVPTPNVAFISSAQYLYRKRSDNSSTLNQSRLNVGRFTAVVEHGFLGLLRESLRVKGYVPEWIQTHVLYELSYYFSDEEAPFGRQTVAVGAVAGEMHRHLGEIAKLLDPDVVRGFSVRPLSEFARETLLYGYRTEPWHTPYVVMDKFDTAQKTVRVTYRFTGQRPDEEFRRYGVPIEPLHQKVVGPKYFDRALVMERIVWLPVGLIRVRLDGRHVEVRTGEPELPNRALGAIRIRRALDPKQVAAEALKPAKARQRRFRDRLIVRLARTKPVRRVFGRAWVLIDRIHDADDSAEHLFRYLRAHDRSTNAWFVIQRGTPGWRRLRKDRQWRVIPHGGLLWKLLMLNCRHLISSHADLPVIRPPAITRLAPPAWRFTFLQHGVIKDDLSRWLNPKDVDVFVVSTTGEWSSIVEDGSPYRYTTREVALTGLPRFDKVREAGEKFPPDRRDLILFTPTWRNWLLAKTVPGSQRWAADLEEFRRSDFVQNWRAVVASEELTKLAARSGLTVGVLMHPNLQALSPALDLPDSVQVFGFEDTDVRELFARARVVVTDYSSMAFNAAYIERPVVYFQFDRERMFSGGHVGRGGYFKYERDGYGPVTERPADALAAIEGAIEGGPDPAPEYQRRIAEAFPVRDGRCCERVVKVIKQSAQKVPPPVAFGDGAAGAAQSSVAVESAETAALDEQRAVDDVIAGHASAEADPAPEGPPVDPSVGG